MHRITLAALALSTLPLAAGCGTTTERGKTGDDVRVGGVTHQAAGVGIADDWFDDDRAAVLVSLRIDNQSGETYSVDPDEMQLISGDNNFRPQEFDDGFVDQAVWEFDDELEPDECGQYLVVYSVPNDQTDGAYLSIENQETHDNAFIRFDPSDVTTFDDTEDPVLDDSNNC